MAGGDIIQSNKISNRVVFLVIIVLIIFGGLIYLSDKNKTISTPDSSKPAESESVNTNTIPVNQEPEAKTQTTSDQKAAALKKVEDQLKISPDDELLKSQRDVLLNDYLADPNQVTPKE